MAASPDTLAKKDLKALIQKALDNLVPNIEVWILEIAGDDPARAAELVLKMAEFSTPKLARKELVGDGGGPVTFEVLTLAPLPSQVAAAAAAANTLIDVTPPPASPLAPPPALALVPPPAPDAAPAVEPSQDSAEAAYGLPDDLDDLL